MEWYYILAILIAFAAIFCGFWYLKKKNIITDEQMKSIVGVISGLTTVTNTIAAANSGNKIFETANMLSLFVNKSVLAAENAWYNDDIDKSERYEYCIERLRELLQAYDVKLTDSQWNLIDTLISASCEEMGHSIDEQ